MEYKIETIGAEFSDKAISALESYDFHSVFQIQQPGCLGLGRGTTTYLAVYVKK